MDKAENLLRGLGTAMLFGLDYQETVQKDGSAMRYLRYQYSEPHSSADFQSSFPNPGERIDAFGPDLTPRQLQLFAGFAQIARLTVWQFLPDLPAQIAAP
jgi:hypothetical protein